MEFKASNRNSEFKIDNLSEHWKGGHDSSHMSGVFKDSLKDSLISRSNFQTNIINSSTASCQTGKKNNEIELLETL